MVDGEQVKTGGCACGKIRFEIRGPSLAQGACHCRACQHSTGGGPAFGMLLLRDQVTITKGEPATYWSWADSGSRVGRHFCADCGTPLFSENSQNPQFLPVKAGALDDPSDFRSQANVWVEDAQPWHYIDPRLPAFPRNPEGFEDMVRA